jgi:hypothetical protein
MKKAGEELAQRNANLNAEQEAQLPEIADIIEVG